MRLLLQRRLTDPVRDSLWGEIFVDDAQEPEFTVVERGWHDNRPGKSCVPAGSYNFEVHDGTKYKQTLALVGATVSHFGDGARVTRSACVLHKAAFGLQLQGCISIGTGITWARQGAWGPVDGILTGLDEGQRFVRRLRELQESIFEQVFLEIREDNLALAA